MALESGLVAPRWPAGTGETDRIRQDTRREGAITPPAALTAGSQSFRIGGLAGCIQGPLSRLFRYLASRSRSAPHLLFFRRRLVQSFASLDLIALSRKSPAASRLSSNFAQVRQRLESLSPQGTEQLTSLPNQATANFLIFD